MATKYKAENVAKYIIFLASQKDQEESREGVTNLKLQKVLYLTQAYYLAKVGRPLFCEKIEAWSYGPVIREVYNIYKSNASNPIIQENDQSDIVEEDKEIIKQVWGLFGGYSASKLVDIVHSHLPWRESIVSNDKIISHKSIKDYYAPLLNK